jgi:hypothetical protein|uniref:DUF3307 domain-containing protein n=1 Tax=Gelidibacter sp. TaxID=2018083 RepID=UPI00404AEB9F
MILLLKLLLAHLIGDFFLQPQSWVEDKEAKKIKSPKLYLHIAIHLALLFVLVWDVSLWKMLLLIGFSHYIIDALKLVLQQKSNRRFLFFIDQLLHIGVIFIAYFWYSDVSLSLDMIMTEQSLLMFICLLFLTLPVSIFMKVIFLKWNIAKLTEGKKSLKDAGKYIGVLERVLVFVFVILDHWEAVGFLITAKSVFRFGDLTAAKQRKLTEYVLIGTLISFGIAILTGLIYLAVVQNLA